MTDEFDDVFDPFEAEEWAAEDGFDDDLDSDDYLDDVDDYDYDADLGADDENDYWYCEACNDYHDF